MAPALGGTGDPASYSMGKQFAAQAIGVGAVALWSAVASAVIAVLVSWLLPMRVGEDEEREGLDITSHGERAWEIE